MRAINKLPSWMQDFYAEHGVLPIAGGSGTGTAENPPGTETPPPVTPTDEGSGFPNAPEHRQPPAEKNFSVEDIEKARREERDKLYTRLNSFDEEVKKATSEAISPLQQRIEEMEAERERERAEREAAQKQEEEQIEAQREAAQKQEESELSDVELVRRKNEELQAQFERMQAEREQERAIMEKERELSALNEYKAKRVTEETESIAPQFMDYINGDSEDEIEASIEKAKAKTAEIMTDFQLAEQQQRQQAPGTRISAPPVGPDAHEEGTRTFTPEEIKAMSMADYQKYRSQLQQAASQGGLYG